MSVTTVVLRSMMGFLCLSLAAVLLVDCPRRLTGRAQREAEPLRVRLGQKFNLRVGQQAAVEGESFKLRFAKVVNDSRCPEDVTCVWAGNAEVLIEVEAKGRLASLKLHTQGGTNFPKEATHQRYHVTLVALSPHPRSNRRTEPTDYVVTLMIHKE